MKESLFRELFSLEGRVALITGATKGLGREIVMTLAAAGADVGICSRNGEEAQAVAREIANSTGRRTVGIQADVSRGKEIEHLVDQVGSRLGPIDILVACAGINVRKGTRELTEEDWDAVMDINVKGAFWTARAVLPGMKERGFGRIVFLGSIMSFVSIPGRAAYSSAKAALLGLTRALALEFAEDGVCVNALCPGPFDTPMNWPVKNDPEKNAAFMEIIPVSRWGDPSEIRGITLYLCSPACSFMTGSSIVIDGGWTAR